MGEKIKKWAAVLAVALLCVGAAGMAAPMQVRAAEETELTTVATTQRCSIWSAPATMEENRVKYVDAGYQITIYPEVIESGLGDGKTFYRTVRGSYVLCRCVEGAGIGTGNENGAGNTGVANGTASAGGNWAPWVSPVNAAVPPAYNAADVCHRETIVSGFGETGIIEYDASGKEIRRTWYRADGTINYYIIYEYDAAGNKKEAVYNEDGSFKNGGWSFVEDINEVGKARKYTYYNSDGTVDYWEYYEEWDERIKKHVKFTRYYPDGCHRIYGSQTIIRSDSGELITIGYKPTDTESQWRHLDGSPASREHMREEHGIF